MKFSHSSRLLPVSLFAVLAVAALPATAAVVVTSCLDELKLEAAKSNCNTCEHCYGKPIMGDSGEGYECITGIECADASGEFGDNPGVGEGIAKVVSNIGEVIGDTFSAIGDFFQNIFSGGKDETTAPAP